jgi:hypothetical protein
MSSQVARLKAQLDAKQKAAESINSNKNAGPDLLTGHFTKNRTRAEKEKIQIETAKKMASRFNLTYRALALSQAKKAAENRKRDLEATKAAKDAASRYQMTARALQMSSTGTATGKVNVFNLDLPMSATTTTVDDIMQGGTYGSGKETTFTSLQELSTSIAAVDIPPVETVIVVSHPPKTIVKEREEDEQSLVFVENNVKEDDNLTKINEVDEEAHSSHDAFYLPDLSNALQAKDES